MTDNQNPNHTEDQLDQLINSLLDDPTLHPKDIEGINRETQQLLETSIKVVALAKDYPEEVKISSQDRIRLLTEFRSLQRQASNASKKNRFRKFNQNQFQWAAAGMAFLILIAVLLFTTDSFSGLTASAGIQSSIVPILILTIAIIAAAIILLRRK
jgi:hypothetical protein